MLTTKYVTQENVIIIKKKQRPADKQNITKNNQQLGSVST